MTETVIKRMQGLFHMIHGGSMEQEVQMNVGHVSDQTDKYIEIMLSLFHTRDVIYLGGEREETFFPNPENTPHPMVLIDHQSDPWYDQQQGDADIAEHEECKTAQWDIDGLLGMYDPKQCRIVLYAKSITRAADEYSKGLGLLFEDLPDFNLLANVVLLHALGHWASHRVKDLDGNGWTDFLDASEQNREKWAQILAYWTMREMHREGEKLCNVFHYMRRKQRGVYTMIGTGAMVDIIYEAEGDEGSYDANFLLGELLSCRRCAGESTQSSGYNADESVKL